MARNSHPYLSGGDVASWLRTLDHAGEHFRFAPQFSLNELIDHVGHTQLPVLQTPYGKVVFDRARQLHRQPTTTWQAEGTVVADSERGASEADLVRIVLTYTAKNELIGHIKLLHTRGRLVVNDVPGVEAIL